MSFWDQFTTEIKSVIPKKKPEAVLKARVGEGMTPTQTTTAYKTIAKKDVKPSSFWDQFVPIAKETIKGIPKATKEVYQPIFQPEVNAVKNIKESVTHPKKTFVEGLAKLGSNVEQSIGSLANPNATKEEKKKALETFSNPVIGASTGLEFTPGTIEKIVASRSAPEISALLRKEAPKLSQETADNLGNILQHVSDRNTVEATLNRINYNLSKIPLNGNETPQEILKLAEDNAATKHLKFDENGNPLAYTAREQAIVDQSKKVPFLPNTKGPVPDLPELPQTVRGGLPAKQLGSYSSPQDTINKVNFQVNGDTPKQKIQSAITNSESIKNDITSRGQSAYVAGSKLSPTDVKLAETYEASTTSVPEIVARAENPVAMKKFMDKLVDYYDFRLAADRAAGGTTARESNYIPHQWDLSKPQDLANFNRIAMQRGLQPYNGFKAQPRVFGSYAEGEALGFKRANPNILEDLKKFASLNLNVNT